MPGYTPLFSSIVTSSIWGEDNDTRILWITMLAMADMHGVVDGSVPGLAHVARIPVKACERALKSLSAPDRYSRTQELEGRRIVKVEGGWRIVNHAIYRQKAKSRAEDQRRYRDRKRAERMKKQTSNTTTNANANSVTPRGGALPAVTQRIKDEFEKEFWPNVPNKVGKGKARDAYIKARKIAKKEKILAGLPNYVAYAKKRSSQPDYRPLHPATWLNQERWTDEPEFKRKKSPDKCCICGGPPTMSLSGKHYCSKAGCRARRYQ